MFAGAYEMVGIDGMPWKNIAMLQNRFISNYKL